MPLEVLKEVTEWADNTKNHTYLYGTESGKIYAYRICDTGEIKVFSKGMGFSKSRRKFKKIKDNELLTSIESQ